MGKAVTERIAQLEAALRNCDADDENTWRMRRWRSARSGNLVYAGIEHTSNAGVERNPCDICRTISAKLVRDNAEPQQWRSAMNDPS